MGRRMAAAGQARGNCNGPKVWVGRARVLKGEDATKKYTRAKGGRRINKYI